MKRRTVFVALFVACFSVSVLPSETGAYSDWTGAYARIDKVVLEPNASAPDRIQIWGAFALASKEDRNSYDQPERGYLYYSLAPGKEEVCRKEWTDLKAAAGTGQIVGFGSRGLARPRVRKPDEKPSDPDIYPVSHGLVKMSDRMSDYAPIRSLQSLPREQN